jgi:hypothetical protein
VDNLDEDRATAELERNKAIASGRGFYASLAKPPIRINSGCLPQAGLLTSFSAKSKSSVPSFVAQRLPLVFQPITLDKSIHRVAT